MKAIANFFVNKLGIGGKFFFIIALILLDFFTYDCIVSFLNEASSIANTVGFISIAVLLFANVLLIVNIVKVYIKKYNS